MPAERCIAIEQSIEAGFAGNSCGLIFGPRRARLLMWMIIMSLVIARHASTVLFNSTSGSEQ